MVLGAAGLAALATFGSPLVVAPSPAAATNPVTANGVIQLAKSLVGLKWSELKATAIFDPPWASYNNEWCAAFTSWLLHSVGAGSYQTFASGQFAAFPEVSSPLPGDIIYYPDPGHVGIITSIDGGIRTLEGNVPGSLPWTQTWVKEFPNPWTSYRICRPPYAPQEENNDMPTPFMTVRSQSQTINQVTQAQINAVLAPPSPSTSTALSTLMFADGSVDTNLVAAPQPANATLFDIVASFHFSGLTAGAFATIRSVYWSKTDNTRATVMATTIHGAAGGKVQGQHAAHATLNNFRTTANTRLVIEVGASVPGVVLDYWRVDGYAW